MDSRVVDIGIIGLIVLGLLGTVLGYQKGQVNAEGRFGTIERVMLSVCAENRELDGCETVLAPFVGIENPEKVWLLPQDATVSSNPN